MVSPLIKTALLVAWLGLGLAAPIDAQEQGTGPTSLVITYTSAASHRPGFREYLEREALPQFERWKADGVFADYRFFFSWLSGSNTWDAMAVLDFARYADLQRWKDIDRKYPGGLSDTGLALASPSASYLADAVWHKAVADRTPGKAVYLVIPYQYSSVGEYKAYADAYVVPQYEGWIKEGVLTAYTAYLSHHTAGKPWDALMVLEYRDIEGLAKRELVKNKVRADLGNTNAAWKKASENKESKRTEEEVTIADPIRR